MDDNEIRKLLARAEEGDDAAYRQLAKFYFDTDATKQLDGEAMNAFRRGVERGNTHAPYMLAKVYIRSGTPEELAQCPDLFLRSVKAGHTFVWSHLGYCYQEGIGVDKNPKKAISCYMKAARKGDAEPISYAAYVYFFDLHNTKKGLRLYAKSARKGSATAAYTLGVLYESSDKIPHDAERSIYWYRCSGQLSGTSTAAEIASIYADGSITVKDMEKAVYYYRLGAAAGDDDCMTSLALCLLHGDGTEKDPAKALRLLQRAADLGNEDAQAELQKLRDSDGKKDNAQGEEKPDND